ncbi:Ger(x)C family spore germination protein [Paenibacillus oryzisoli]|nr:Ger(x)C family spore germination protein [Paenibacillus oryzisoli]
MFGLFVDTGCATDVKDIDKLNYASTIGVDYKDGKYHGYIQFNDFQTVAKTNDTQRSPAKIWVGEGIGDSFEESLFDLYRSAQERIYWGHVTAIVISEAAFKQGIRNIYDSFVRYYEFRLTPWVYGTRGSVKDILSTGGFFGQSPLSTILHEPTGNYSQTSYIKPIKLHKLIGQMNENGFTSCIPTLAVNKKNWTVQQNKEPKLMIDGAIFLKNEVYKSFIPLEGLTGLRWIQSGTVRAGVSVPDKTEPAVQIVVDNPKTKVKMVKIDDRPQFNIDMNATGYVVSRTNNNLLGIQQLTQKSTERIEKEIRKSFMEGLKRNTDIYNLEHELFRYHYQEWKSISQVEGTLLNENEIRNVHIDLNIKHTSNGKNSTIHKSN